MYYKTERISWKPFIEILFLTWVSVGMCNKIRNLLISKSTEGDRAKWASNEKPTKIENCVGLGEIKLKTPSFYM